MLRALGAKTLRESEGSQNGPFGAREASPPASEASDEPRSGEQVYLKLVTRQTTVWGLDILKTSRLDRLKNQT